MEPFEASSTRCPGLALSGSEFSGFCLDRGPFGGGGTLLSPVLATTYDPKFSSSSSRHPWGLWYNVPMNDNDFEIDITFESFTAEIEDIVNSASLNQRVIAGLYEDGYSVDDAVEYIEWLIEDAPEKIRVSLDADA